ncbi:cadherin-related family member 2 [Rhincodon typus]|uniref:cadherin-related family member 2 n=1 Tax=Rhincodon typus TaxID=259920 RepID=UPI00202DF075|nr:cadherin-related family member 2 [Rhincodon typus]
MSSHNIKCILLLGFCLVMKAKSAPIFASNMTVVYVAEDTPRGAVAYKIIASDPSNDPLNYAMSGVDSTFFKLDSNTGIVTVARDLDREVKSTLSITISATNGRDKTSLKQTIILKDANDNAPIFLNAPYKVSVYENETKGAVLFTVKAKDRDQGPAGTVRYEIVGVLPHAPYLFEIQQGGKVILNGTLSYTEKSTFYQLQIKASDYGGLYNGTFIVQHTTTFALINVEDVSDLDPIFLNIPYQTTVPENSKVGTTVLQVTAVDGDRGINSEITYSILTSKPPDLFGINAQKGDIFVLHSLDREELLEFNTVVELQVMAKEKHLDINGAFASAITKVSITVTDINDNTPAFYDCILDTCNFTESPKVNSFHISIPEHFSSGVPLENLAIVARDPDQGVNGTFTLSLHGANASDFTVSPKEIKTLGVVQIAVKNSDAIDYERKKVSIFEIVANDTTNPTKCCSTATVTIDIVDINDHSPEFPQQTYILSVKENSDIGTVFGIVTAIDPDTGLFGKITYSLLQENIQEFKVDNRTGEIMVANKTLLDREKRPRYYATLQATDGGGRKGTTSLEIVLEDINDNHPVMSRESYTAFITENQGNDLNIKIEAFDNDEVNTNNSEIRYTIVAGDDEQNFTIDPISGVLRSIGPIDREAMKSSDGKINLIVKAYDLGVPSLSTTVNVTIHVEDVNDYSPVFSQSVYYASVMEHTLGAFVTLVKANDNDATEVNNRITYRIENGGSGIFLIRSILINNTIPKQYGGNLTVDPTIALDYDKGPKFYNLSVSASDLGTPSKIAHATVHVTVLDMNDETPVLDPDSMKDLDVMENNTELGIVRNITATDIDTNHSLIYQLVSTVCYKSKIIDARPDAPCHYWFGLYDNGSLYVNESSVIDYEEYDQVDMTIRVTDLYTEKNNASSIGKLTINIVDANDNRPVFLALERVSVIVPELAPISAEVATVKASDNDTGKNAAIEFFVVKVLFIFSDGKPNRVLPDLFEASRSAFIDGEYTATIKIKSSLDKTLKGQYKVTVEARDGGKPTLYASSDLDLITVDESYKTRLEFTVTPEEVQQNMNEIIALLREATYSNPYVASVTAVTNEKVQSLARNIAKATMELYFVYNNGTAIPPEQVNSKLQLNPEAVKNLLDLGLLNIKETTESSNNERLFVAIISGLVGGFVILLTIMITALVCSRESYKRKIRSITAMNTAKTITGSALQNGLVVPGTNKYALEGANPVWNTIIDTATDLVFENNNSDRASINSLDENMVNAVEDTHAKKPNMLEGPTVTVEADHEMTEKTVDSYLTDAKAKPLRAALVDHDNNKENASGATGNGFHISQMNNIDI